LNYGVVLKASAERELEHLPARLHDRIVERLVGLSGAPRPRGSKKLHGAQAYRVRVGDYRILYAVDDPRRRVTVYSIGHRRDVYR
jgi:mRNA interferase RelE/StbE